MISRVIIFGSDGMLGRYLTKWLGEKYNIITLTRGEFDVLDYIGMNMTRNLETFLDKYQLDENTLIINCIGLIPQASIVDDMNYIYINSIFPVKLANICNKNNCKLIHPTTDCVYNGEGGYPYTEDSIKNESGIYGLSKMLGENINATVIRTSIIGEQLKNGYSLLEVVKSKRGRGMNGYVNHYWNGITCLQYSKIVEIMIENDIFWKGVRHIYSPKGISKYELVKLINKYYNLNILINPICVGDIDINKTLSTKYEYHDEYQLHDLNKYIPMIEKQIEELVGFNIN